MYKYFNGLILHKDSPKAGSCPVDYPKHKNNTDLNNFKKSIKGDFNASTRFNFNGN